MLPRVARIHTVLGFGATLVLLIHVSTAQGQLFQASLKNGDYGAGTAVPPTSGVVNTPEGVRFVSTETTGRSSAVINWQLLQADRTPFRTAGTISFCFRADRATLITGEILGENYGYGQFRNGQGTFSAFAARVANGPGDTDDQVRIGWNTWHNGAFLPHASATLELDRTYRVGFAWGATSTRFEIWADGVMVAADNAATLPWGSSSIGTGSGTNVSLGSNHERGLNPFASAAGVFFSNIRIAKGHAPFGDTQSGCLAMSIVGPATATTNRPVSFEAMATGCAISATGWSWSATGGATIDGGTTRAASIRWPSAGTHSVTASNSACAGTNASKTVSVSAAPANVVVTAFPAPLAQDPNVGGATTSFTLFNEGDSPTNITLTQQGSFFTTSSAAFNLAARASQIVTITGTAQAANVYRGAVIPAGVGVPSGLTIPVVLLSAAAPAVAPRVVPNANRVDVAEDPANSPSGSLTFVNSGPEPVNGALVSTVPWMIPQSSLVVIPVGGSATVTFAIDRSKRPDSSAPLGSVSGELQLVSRNPTAGKTTVSNGGGSIPNSTVTVVDTARPPVTTGAIPPLAPGEVALFIPGVGHALGSVGLFLSDVSIASRASFGSITDAKLYYTALGGSASAQIVNVASIAANQPLAIADLVNTVFKKDAQIGSLQIRSKDAESLSIGATIFNASSPKGTFGTTIPLFRSDRGVAPGGTIVLTGLRSDSSGHTNFYFQETAGLSATVSTRFLSASGSVIGTRSDSLAPFALHQASNVVPIGAVAAILTNDSTSAGRFLAYATPVDRASGDTWAVADWRQLDRYEGGEPVLIPIAGAVHGANNTYFRTDLAVTNVGTAPASGTLRYFNRTGVTVDRALSLAPSESRILNDVVTTLFGVETDSVGHLQFTPSSGTFAVTSRTYTTVINDVATFGTGVPTRSYAASLEPGDVRRMGGIDDAALSTVSAARPASFRTNFALIETAGEMATIRVTVRFAAAAGTVAANIIAWKDYNVAPRQLILLSNVAHEILGPARSAYGDLRNMQVEFAHIGGRGAVEIFLSSVDNGTGDSTLRVE